MHCTCFGVVFGIFILSVPVWSVTEDDVKECGSFIFGRVLCTSYNSFYRECIVPGATSIDLIKIYQNFTQEECIFKKTFGYRGNAVWVNKGCSGEFYVCYEGVRVSTDYPVLTVTMTPRPGKTTPRNTDVAIGSTSGATDNNMILYIVIVISVVLVVGIGVLIGCLVKRRQQRDRARHLAEKRQASIDQKSFKSQMEDNDASVFPVATISLDSVGADSSSTRNGSIIDGANSACVAYEQEGSVCSSQSSMSEFTSVSAQTTGHVSGQMAGFRSLDKRSSSASEINTIGRLYSEPGPISKPIRNDRSYQGSLESIREICNRYQMVDIPMERRYKKKSEHRNKYNTVGFSGSNSDAAVNSGTMTLPINRTKTRALIHVSPPHIPKDVTNPETTRASSFSPHYHEPHSLGINVTHRSNDTAPTPYLLNGSSRNNDNMYARIHKAVPQRENSAIYATVTKSCLKTAPSSENINGSHNVSFEDNENKKRENNNDIYTIHGKHYAYLQTFRPPENNSDILRTDLRNQSLDLKATPL